jgi:hypothetical protein
MKIITIQPYKRAKPGGTYKTVEVKGYTRILEDEDDLTIRPEILRRIKESQEHPERMISNEEMERRLGL